MVDVSDKTSSPSLKDLIDRIKPVENSRLKPINENALWLEIYNDSNTTEKTFIFKEHLGIRTGKALCLHRWKIWWMIPRLIPRFEDKNQIVSGSLIPPETYFLLVILNDSDVDRYLCILPTFNKSIGFSLGGSLLLSDENHIDPSLIVIRSHSNSLDGPEEAWNKSLLITTGTDPFKLISDSIKILKADIRHSFSYSSKLKPELDPSDINFKLRPYFTNFFGWCTWDSFYTDLSEERVIEGLKGFNQVGVTPRFIILDDGWQDTDVNDKMNGYQWGGRLHSFGANYKFEKDFNSKESQQQEQKQQQQQLDLKSVYDELSRPCGKLASSLILNANNYPKQSLERIISRSKEEAGILSFLVWHTLTGYWTGVSPTSKELSKYPSSISYPHLSKSLKEMSKANKLESEPFTVSGVGLVDSDHAQLFFEDYHSHLKSMGVDGVKVDAQSILPELIEQNSNVNGTERVFKYHKALKSSISRNFANSDLNSNSEFSIIHCMCHNYYNLMAIAALYDDDDKNDIIDDDDDGRLSKQNILSEVSRETDQQASHPSHPHPHHPSFQTNKKHNRTAAVVRGSDDYWPTDEASHGPHLFVNAMNSLLFANIGVHDWDMFQTDQGPPSYLHAASRAISGGPVYISDVAGKHDVALIRKLAFPDGSLPMCIQNAQPSRQSLFTDPQRHAGIPLIMQNLNPCGGGVIGLFNITGSVLENDLDMFRYLKEDEITWCSSKGINESSSSSCDTTCWLNSAISSTFLSGDHFGVQDIPHLRSLLCINWEVSIKDIENMNLNSDTYVSFKHSNYEIKLHSSIKNDTVSINLEKVLSYDIVSFFPIYTGYMDNWVSVIGAFEMFNTGGACLWVKSNKYDPYVEIGLKGSGSYLIVSSKLPSKIEVCSSVILIEEKLKLKPIEFTYIKRSDFYEIKFSIETLNLSLTPCEFIGQINYLYLRYQTE